MIGHPKCPPRGLAALLATVAIAAGAAVFGENTPAEAMTMTIAGDQLIASGPVVPDDIARFRSLVEANPGVKTVVLRNSPGGAAVANDAITVMIEAHNLDTVVTGFCVSACAMIFLSGTNRSYGDLEPMASTSLGFHGNYARGQLGREERLQALKARVLSRTGGKIDPALVDRWLHFADERNTIRFRYPADGTSTAPTTFFCPLGRFPNSGNYANCDAVPGVNALSAGIITSTTIVHVNR